MRLPNIQVDEVEQVADLLATVPRWGGQTIVPFMVLHHLLVVGRLAAEMHPIGQLGAYLHDVEEGVLGADLSTRFKTEEQRVFEEKIRAQVWNQLRIPALQPGQVETVHLIDLLAALGESEILLNPARRAEVFDHHEGETPDAEQLFTATNMVWQVARMHPTDVRQAFLDEVADLRERPEVRAMSERM